MIKNNTIFFSILIILLPQLVGQECADYYKNGDCKSLMKSDFYLTSHSRGGVFEINTQSEIRAAFSGGHDYIVSCCTYPGFYPIHMKIIADNEQETVLYDNMYDDYINSIGFTVDKSQIVIIRVTLLAKGVDPEDCDENRACLGLTVQYRITPKIGF